jgi:hypothetical protein
MVITLVVFMAATNLIVDEYGQGALRTAVDEAARAGSLFGAPGGPIAACQAKAAEVQRGLMPGPIAANVTIICSADGAEVQAIATGSLPSWLHVIPTDTIHVVGTARLELAPTPSS